MRPIAFFLLLPAVLAAEVSGPVVGYAVQPARREVRVILGVPGATHYSEPAAWPEGAASVRTVPGHRWLLALRADGSAASAWVPETGIERSLSNVAGEPSLMAFGASGSAAAFYFREGKRIVVYKGLPDSPMVAAEIAGGEWAALAVSGDARLLAGLSESGELRLLMQDGEATEQLIRESRPVSSFAFLGDGNTLAVAEPGSDRIELIGNVREGVFTRRLLTLPAAITSSARLIPGGTDWFSIMDLDNAAMYRLELTGEVRTLALPAGSTLVPESLRSRGATLLKPPPGDDIPRIVLSHQAGDDLFFLPTLGQENEQ